MKEGLIFSFRKFLTSCVLRIGQILRNFEQSYFLVQKIIAKKIREAPKVIDLTLLVIEEVKNGKQQKYLNSSRINLGLIEEVLFMCRTHFMNAAGFGVQ